MSFKVLSSYPGWYATDLWASLSSFSRLLLASTQVSLDPQPLARLLLSSRALASPSWAWTWSPAPFGHRCSLPGPPPTSFKVFSTFPPYHGEKTMTINPTQRCFGSKPCINLFKIFKPWYLFKILDQLIPGISCWIKALALSKVGMSSNGLSWFVCSLLGSSLLFFFARGFLKFPRSKNWENFSQNFSPGSLDHIGRLLLPSLCPIHQRSFASSEL